MAWVKWIGPLAAGGLLGLLACSSSNSAGPADAGAEDSGRRMLDGGGDVDVAMPMDKTTGMPCSADKDCSTGPGVTVCSTSPAAGATSTIGGVTVQLWTTPICVLPLGTSGGNCDPTSAGDPTGQGLHYCDGPDDPSSPGFCVPNNPNQPAAGQGTCLPKCTFKYDGSPAVGCTGKNLCSPVYATVDKAGGLTGIGYCVGSCESDADCGALGPTYKCQTDIGYCTNAPKVRTKKLGDACTASSAPGSDQSKGACNCDSSTQTDVGFCSTVCTVGGVPCPNGWVCDTGTGSTVQFANGTSATVTMQNQGFSGVCRPTCTPADGGAPEAGSTVVDAGTPGDGGGDAGPAAPVEAGATVPVEAGATAPDFGGACPPNSTCQTGTIVGPDCWP